MEIIDSKGLYQAIGRLNAKKNTEENKIIAQLTLIKQQVDPVYRVRKLLPRKVPIGETLNILIDETIVDSASLLTDRFIPPATGSFGKVAGSHLLRNAVTMAVNKNTFKIKAIGLAIIKNIFK